MRHRTCQGGFTVLEVVIAITLVGLLAWTIAPMFASTNDQSRKYETDRRLRDLRQTLAAGYRMHAFEIDTEPGALLMVDAKAVLSNDASSSQDSFTWAEKFAAQSATTLAKDGYGMPWRIFVSNRLTNNVNGTDVFSHKLAIVSGGRNGRIDAGTTFDVATGTLSLKGDDVGEVIDGYQVQKELLELTRKRMNQLAGAYQAYFLSRFQSNENRNLSINYFVNAPRGAADPAMFDGGGTVASSGGADAESGTLLAATFGIAAADFQDGYGRAILLDNSSDAIRSPDNANAGMQAPPYTVVFKASLPGGGMTAQAVIGTY